MSPTPARGLSRRVALVAAFGLAVGTVAACGSGSTGSASSASAPASPSATVAFPTTVSFGESSVTLDTQPSRIVSLSPTATETLFDIGAGPQVVAVDDNSNYPVDAPRTDLSGFQPNAEAVAGYEPDLVVAANDANGLVASLTKLDVPVLLLPAPATLEESYQQIEALGQATGRPVDAEAIVDDVKERIAGAIASVPATARGMKVYHELDQTYYSATSGTFIGSIYSQFGLVNIADGAKDASGGYPQLSAEYVVTQAPDLIVLADTQCCQQSAQTIADRAGFADVPAVKEGRIVEADDDISSRWGPRTADFAEQIAAELSGQ